MSKKIKSNSLVIIVLVFIASIALIVSCSKSNDPAPTASTIPVISGFSNDRGLIGSSFIIYGANFNTTKDPVIVNFHGDIKANQIETSSDGTQITVAVPQEAQTGKIKITAGSETIESSQEFIVLNFSVDHQYFLPGDIITIKGNNINDISGIIFKYDNPGDPFDGEEVGPGIISVISINQDSVVFFCNQNFSYRTYNEGTYKILYSRDGSNGEATTNETALSISYDVNPANRLTSIFATVSQSDNAINLDYDCGRYNDIGCTDERNFMIELIQYTYPWAEHPLTVAIPPNSFTADGEMLFIPIPSNTPAGSYYVKVKYLNDEPQVSNLVVIN